jgi:hypothetical protein
LFRLLRIRETRDFTPVEVDLDIDV